MQSCTQQTLETFGRECQRISNYSPRVASSVEFQTRTLQIFAHKHLATRNDDHHLVRIDVRCDLLIDHAQKILQRHIGHGRLGATIATAVAAVEVTTQRALPEERAQRVLLDVVLVELCEELQAESFAQTESASVQVVTHCVESIRYQLL